MTETTFRGLLPDGKLPSEARTDVLQIVNEAARQVTGLSWTGNVNLTSLAAEPAMLHATLTGNVTLLLPALPAGHRGIVVTLRLAQDTTGGRTVMIPGAQAAWSTAYVHTGTPNSVDVLHLLWMGNAWLAMPAAQNIGTPTSWVV